MLSAHQTEHLGPKSQVSELVHFEHGINSGAVDSVARRMAFRISKHTQSESTQGMQDSLCSSRQAASVHREPRLFSCNRLGFIVTSTRPQPVPRAAVPLISLACSTGPPEPGTTLHSPRRPLPRGQADKDSLTRWTLGGHIREERPADSRPDLRVRRCFSYRQQ